MGNVTLLAGPSHLGPHSAEPSHLSPHTAGPSLCWALIPGTLHLDPYTAGSSHLGPHTSGPSHCWTLHLGPHCLVSGQGSGAREGGHWLLFKPEPSSFSNIFVHLGHLENRNHPTCKSQVLRRSPLLSKIQKPAPGSKHRPLPALHRPGSE